MSTTDKDAAASPDLKKDTVSPERPPADMSASLQRRKLIKASAAAIPAIMTLRSGAAAAMTSTYHCTARDNTFAREQGVDFVLEAVDQVLPHDNWLRITGKKVTKTHQGQTFTFYCVETGEGTVPALGDWQCFNEADGSEYTGPPPPINSNDITRGKTVALLAFLEFDEHGNDTGAPVLYYPRILQVAPAPPGYSPLTGSCLSSIHPNLNLLG